MTESILYLSILSLHIYGSTHLWVDLPIDLILKIKSPWFNLWSLNYLAHCLSFCSRHTSFFFSPENHQYPHPHIFHTFYSLFSHHLSLNDICSVNPPLITSVLQPIPPCILHFPFQSICHCCNSVGVCRSVMSASCTKSQVLYPCCIPTV